MEDHDWLPEAREQAARSWGDPKTEHLTLDSALAEVIAHRILEQYPSRVEKNV